MRESTFRVLWIGAHHACLRCERRAIAPGTCARCGSVLVDLESVRGQAALARRARRSEQQRAHRAPGERSAGERTYRALAHTVAIASAVGLALWTSKINTAGYVPTAAVKALGVGLGLVAGYLAIALASVVVLLVAAAACTTAAMVIAALGSLALLGAVIMGRQGQAARARVGDEVARGLRAVFAPLRWLRGIEHAPVGIGLRPPRESEALNAKGWTRVEGTLVEGTGRVVLDGLEGAIVGIAGLARGASVADARVADLVVLTDEGERIEVRIEAGAVRVRDKGQSTRIQTHHAGAWGVPSSGRAPEKDTPKRETDVEVEAWIVREGTRVALEGGERSTPHTLRGTAQAPMVITVMEGSR